MFSRIAIISLLIFSVTSSTSAIASGEAQLLEELGREFANLKGQTAILRDEAGKVRSKLLKARATKKCNAIILQSISSVDVVGRKWFVDERSPFNLKISCTCNE